jgi:hypothetical protein
MPTSFAFTAESADHTFSWDLATDQAQLVRRPEGEQVWSGSLLPLFWLIDARGQARAVKAVARREGSRLSADRVTLRLELPDLADGQLEIALVAGHSIQLKRLELTWRELPPPAISALYFGCTVLTPAQRCGVPTLDLPFWPNWRSEGYCIASAKTAPMQSFFRSWDFGHANLPLGSFGPAMGTPYAAAFPRPTYAGCAGGRHGWICFGAGSVPDAALTFQVRARSGALEWRYREDLWGAVPGATRVWEDPLWITWSAEAWQSYRQYFALFPASAPKPHSHQKTFWGTWGDFRLGRFEWRSAIDRAMDEMEADLICIDEPWEVRKGAARPHRERFPTFDADIAYAHERKLGLGIWTPTGWIQDYAAEGLTRDDVLLGRDGEPVRGNWAVDPHEPAGFYCLDPGSPGARQYLRERTRRVMREYRPSLLKIDFGYGLPGPDACVSRDPACRGERIAWTYATLIANAAREIDPNVTILGYSIHPLWGAAQDQVSLDDLGDAGAYEASGHGHWSIWAALTADRSTAVMGSSGYLWEADPDVMLDSAVLGAPGTNLPRALPDGSALPAAPLARRRGLFRWHRPTTAWQPLWLDSSRGTLEEEPITRNWGRLETVGGRPVVTALALRQPSAQALADPELRGLTWSGRWIVLAQGPHSIFDGGDVALIPLEEGALQLPRTTPPREVQVVFADRTEPLGGWRWHDGRVEVVISRELAQQPLLGLLVRS